MSYTLRQAFVPFSMILGLVSSTALHKTDRRGHYTYENGVYVIGGVKKGGYLGMCVFS